MSDLIEFPGPSGSVDAVLEQERRERSERRRRRLEEILAPVTSIPDAMAEHFDAIDARLATIEHLLMGGRAS